MSLIELYRNRVSQDVEPKLREKAKEILRCYRHSWDIFSELIQNAVDAINRRYKILNEPDFYLYHEFRQKYNVTSQPNYRGTIKIKIDILSKSITVEDNGVGIESDNLARFLLPDESGKLLGKEYGFKGYGLTFAAFISREFKIKSRFFVSEETYELGFNGLFDWLIDTRNEVPFPQTPNPQVTRAQLFLDGEKINTSITVRLEDDYESKFPAIASTDSALKYIEGVDHLDRFKYIIRSRTAIGNTRALFNKPPIVPIDISLEVMLSDGNSHIEAIPYEFFHPREHNEIKFLLYDFADYVNQLSLASFNRDFRGLYYTVTEQSIGQRNPIQCDISILAASSTRLSNIESSLLLDQVEAGDVNISYGVYLAINGMPTGIRIDDWDTRGSDRKRYYVIVDANLEISSQLDSGRKGISKHFANMISERVWELIGDSRINGSDTFSRYAVKFLDVGRATALLPTQTQEFQEKVNEVRQETSRQEKKEAELIQQFRKTTSLLNFPSDEQEVIATFYCLLSRGIIKGYKTVYLSGKATYDAAFEYEIECNYDNVHPLDPLGIAQLLVDELKPSRSSKKQIHKYVHKERFVDLTKSPELCVEFKRTLGDFLQELSRSGQTNKNPNDIDILIVWDDTIPASISSASYTLALLPDHKRIFHSTTHQLGIIGTHSTDIKCIVLKTVLQKMKI